VDDSLRENVSSSLLLWKRMHDSDEIEKRRESFIHECVLAKA